MWIKWYASRANTLTILYACPCPGDIYTHTHAHAHINPPIAICICMTIYDWRCSSNVTSLKTKLHRQNTYTHKPIHTHTHALMRSYATPCCNTLTRASEPDSEHPQDWATGQICVVTPFIQTPFRVIWRLMWCNYNSDAQTHFEGWRTTRSRKFPFQALKEVKGRDAEWRECVGYANKQ